MARKKKELKVKEPVVVRFKELANGNKSIYLDIYKDGKREYKFLKMYIVPEVDVASRVLNTNTLTQVASIKAQMVQDINNGKANIKASTRSKMLLIDWLEWFKEHKENTSRSNSFANIIGKTQRYVEKYNKEVHKNNVRLCDVDKDYCLGFLAFIKSTISDKGEKLSQATQRNYYKVLNCAINKAVKDDVIQSNPFTKIPSEEKISMPDSNREYLTIDEVKALMNTPCKNDKVKNAFLFSCFTGLRCSDVEALRWQDIHQENGRYRINIIVIKTNRTLSITLSPNAVNCIPFKCDDKPTDKVFKFPSSAYHNVVLKYWAEEAGVTKHISFHVARHTFATLGIEAGADLYTIGKILGHTQIKTTQIYAKVMDKKRDEAVDAVSNLFK